MESGAGWKVPKSLEGINRTLYFYRGSTLEIDGRSVGNYQAVDVEPDRELYLQNGNKEAGILMLQGRPIDEPVIQYGPFVMNTKEEINQTFEDYNRTKFGGWPWPKYDYVHPRNRGRFARHADGRVEERS